MYDEKSGENLNLEVEHFRDGEDPEPGGSLILKALTNLLKSIYLMVSSVCGNCVNNLSSFIRMSSSPR